MKDKFDVDYNNAMVGLNLSADPSTLKEGEYTMLLNGCLNSTEGRTQYVRMYAGNMFRSKLSDGYYPIEQIPVNHKEICIFSVNPTTGDGEIGVFDGRLYTAVANSVELGFDIRSQIQAVIDEDFNNHKSVMWVQQDKPVRFMDLNNPPMINGVLDVDALSVFKKYSYPEVKIQEVLNNGRLLAGSYYVSVQYSDENSNGLTSWSIPKGPIYIYRDAISQPKNFINGSPDREITGKSIRIAIENLDPSFRFYNIGIIKSFDGIRQAYVVVTLPVIQNSYLYTGNKVTEQPIDLKDIETPATPYVSAKTIARSNGTVLLGNLKGRKEYNLQPFISKIHLQWQSIREKYDTADKTYANPLSGTYGMSLRRNEIYTFGLVVRWNDGSTTRTYPFVGRQKNKTAAGSNIQQTIDQNGQLVPLFAWDDYKGAKGDDIFETGSTPERWKTSNTAFKAGTDLPAFVDATGPAEYGEFGYWESTDRYPNNPLVWGTDAGQPIRHFMAPDVIVAPLTDGENGFKTDKDDSYVYKLGVRFENINGVMDSLPAEIKNQMQGWEVVRGDRRGNKTVIASGLMFNMRYQNWKDGANGPDDIRLFQNFPLNDLRPIEGLRRLAVDGLPEQAQHDRYKKDIFSFTSADTEFDKTMLLTGELQIHSEVYGVAKAVVEMVKPYPNVKVSSKDDEFHSMFYHMATIGYYNNWKKNTFGNLRRKLTEAMYVPFNAQVSGGNTGIPMHNLMQEHTVLLQVNKPLTDPTMPDTTNARVSNSDFGCKIPRDARYRSASSFYASIIARLENQYGSVYDTKYISTNADSSSIVDNVPVLIGDTFVGPYGTKRQFTYYQNAQSYIGFADGSRGIDLKNSSTVPGTVDYYTSVPKYIADNSHSECIINDFFSTAPNHLINMIQTGVPFFFTESDHNIDLQLNGQESFSTFYPNLKDGSLTLHKWSGIENIDKPNEHLVNKAYEEPNDLYGYLGPDPYFDSTKTEANHYSTRVIFSLTNSAENRFNNITVFSALNYYDFRRDCGELWDIRDLGNNRILFRLEHGMFMDRKYATIPLENNKIQLGSGKLFETEPELIVKDDGGYLGTRSQWAFNSTPYGSFFVDTLRACVFQFTENANDISQNGADSYFLENLPLKLLADLPYFKDSDNPANPQGVGYLSVFDRINKMWILTKKDYEVIDKTTINHFSYNAAGKLLLNDIPVSLDNAAIFANRSFTFCYSPLSQKWVGWQSFMPTSYGTLQKEYYSFANGAIWQHNKGLPRTYYDKRYPFIFEGVASYKNGESMAHSCSWTTRTFPIINNVQAGETFDNTFNKGIFYNEQQSTGNIILTVQDENDLSKLFNNEKITSNSTERFLRRRERNWIVAELYDLVKDHNKSFFSGEYDKLKTMYYIDKIVNDNNIDYSRNFQECAPLNDLWMKYRLIFDKEEDVQMFIYLTMVMNEVVII